MGWLPPSAVEARLKVALLRGVEARDGELLYHLDEPHGPDRAPPRERLCGIDWSRIRQVLAADVGEPEGVQAVIFDLVVRGKPAWEPDLGRDSGQNHQLLRFDAEPGDNARNIARVIIEQLGSQRCSLALCSVAEGGIAHRWYPDLESLDEAHLEFLQRF